ncbi:MAG TPA: 1,6-anhydro-N-acetylmuramyl-L-alanine amidase AmpD [Candidatus Aphodousia faecigallinarum]|uniref:1,6-anhydro-N-acetylmuramyl-L-alanine amidase AmpD n=1 Tax=Candidatus Aphodousia faecigallinarum TaxID=2840677 RepID=A0A9D1IIT9_9BURK|nr:1,6-anhydro-N-acetylmuramyl-L-alanine amidase AmpD [Candidatus Aphodousia faecigallinarum]
MKINREGWIEGEGCVCVPSPFFDDREGQLEPDLVVMHNISLPAGAFGLGYVQALFKGELINTAIQGFESLKGLKVSSHFFIDRKGLITQFVSTKKRAWHAGKSIFQGRSRCNDFSIGIEMEGSDFVAFEPEQYQALKKLLVTLIQSEPRLSFITGHSDIAPDRKTDPGPYFDWKMVLSVPEISKRLKYSTIQTLTL